MMTGLLGFDIYDRLYDLAKYRIDSDQDVLDGLTEDVRNKTVEIEKLDISLGGIDGKISVIKGQMNERKEFIKTTNEEIATISVEPVDFDAELAKLDASTKICISSDSENNTKLSTTNKELMKASSAIGSLGTEKRLSQEAIVRLEAKVSKLRTQKFGERCEVCGSPVTEENSEAAAKLKVDEITEILKKIEKLDIEIDAVNSEKQVLTDQVSDIQATLKASRAKVSEIRSQIQQLNEDRIANQRKDMLTKSVDAAFAEIENAKSAVEKQIAERQKVSQAKIRYADEIIGIEARRQDLVEITEKMEFWKKAFSPTGIKSLLLDRFCNEFNQMANEYMSTISNGSMSILIRPTKALKSGEERNKIGIDINFDGVTVAYESLSGGEKKRVDIALCLALNKWVAARYRLPSGLLGFIVLDEIFAFLDSLGEEAIGTLLYKEGQSKAVYVISHTNELSSYANKYLTVVKTSGVSALREGGYEEGGK
jgi:DNA repair exonuclease SbcCD ATPase subunit